MLLLTILDTEQHGYVDIIHSSAQSLLALINDILDFRYRFYSNTKINIFFSKLEANKVVFESEEFEFNKIVTDAIVMFSAAAQSKSVQLTCDMDPATPQCLRGDPNRVRYFLCAKKY